MVGTVDADKAPGAPSPPLPPWRRGELCSRKPASDKSSRPQTPIGMVVLGAEGCVTFPVRHVPKLEE